MSASSDNLYGAGGGERATPGSYGQPPAGVRLPEATRLGPVRLQVADLQRSQEYYTHVLGLRQAASSATSVSLAPHGDNRILLELHEQSGAARADGRPHWGLYHFALLLPDRASLGRFVRHLAQVGVRAGAGDHLVSEAFYLTDPDGLAIEVYADRPRDTWRRRGRELMLATDPVQVPELLRAAGDTAWTGMPAGTVMGHVHLHVGDIATAGDFYGETIGFDRTTWSYPGALFLGAGGYHHHVGTNTWAGASASAPRADDARLLAWTVELPSAADVEALAARLEAAGHVGTFDENRVLIVVDPWGTPLRVAAAGAA
ncbi:MAG TPA: VOC family protein [Luteitalea sp.]|nr:VOC family protein [Luteitalea sp.]